MPNRRTGPRGSFGSDLDQLVQKFHQKPPEGQAKTDEEAKADPHINDRLFEEAWRKDPAA